MKTAEMCCSKTCVNLDVAKVRLGGGGGKNSFLVLKLVHLTVCERGHLSISIDSDFGALYFFW